MFSSLGFSCDLPLPCVMNTAFLRGAWVQRPAEQGVVDGVGCICSTDYYTVTN